MVNLLVFIKKQINQFESGKFGILRVANLGVSKVTNPELKSGKFARSKVAYYLGCKVASLGVQKVADLIVYEFVKFLSFLSGKFRSSEVANLGI